ncbi:major facilitator superfamily domain-containing protein [Podospora aff. communis PSN243]|uniref:Major facilitator superfamily domain-containing protein n=1 Tax=Podospora aff. communis PSN243 TaxID=3040156 RepID=A0AAV9GAK4_9PEZI|nr:major facilitator superfamily domain-containing protein [Podospora aff. communis PSN243]
MTNLLHFTGLASLHRTGPDAYLIILSRTSRMFAYGASALILALFFSSLGFSDARIGVFMTLTLLGDVLLSLILTQIADRVGRRRTLLFGSVLMVLSGVVFATCESYWLLLLAAVVGVVSATGGDFGPFRAIEESVVAELTTPETRADVLVWYVTMASLGSSAGTELAGRMVEGLRAREGWELVDAYHACFWLYAVMGVVNVGVNLMLSERCELRVVQRGGEGEREGLLEGVGEEEEEGGEKKKGKWFAQISRETLGVMAVLWFLLSVDSVADGMVSMSLTTYYIDQKFHPAKSTLGDFLSASYFLSSLSTIFSGPLSRYIGLVNTMVFTHIPSSAAVLLFPFPQSLGGTFALLLLRVGLNNMDQAPRAALIAAVVRPEERTAVMGITVLFRTLASVTGPTVTGFLAANDKFWVAFVAAGALRLAYDLGLFAMFINIKLYKHEPISVAESQGSLEDDEGQERARRAEA